MSQLADRIRVLHVDDEPAFGDLTVEFLERQDDRFVVTTVTSASETLDYLADNDVDCVVSDYDMPGKNGVELLRAVREEYPDLPFILFTGKGSEEVASEAISAGVTDYLQKSGGADQYALLANRMSNAVERHAAEREIDWHRAILRNMGEGVYVLDAEYVIRFVKFRIPELESVSEENWTGRSLSYLAETDNLSWTEVTWIQEAVDRILSGETDEVRIELEPAFPEPTNVIELRLSPLELDSDEQLVLGTTRDITQRKRHERELSEEKAFTEATLEGIADFYWEIDLDGRVLRWSDENGEVTGYPTEEAVGLHTSTFHPDDHFPRIRGAIEELKAEGSVRVEADLLTKDGERVPYYFTGTTLTDGDGNVHSMCGLGMDITERKRRERRLERFETMVEATDEAAFIVDEDRTLDYANEAALNNIGASFEAVEGRSIRSLADEYVADEDGSERFVRALERAFDADDRPDVSERVELTLDADGRNPVFEYQLSPIVEDGAVRAVVVMSREITDRTAYERELERQNDRLEEFASVVSHDLRNPLQVARTQLALADEECDSEHLDDAVDAIDRSQALIDDLLTLAQEGEGVTDLEPVVLGDVVERCWGNVETAGATLVADVDRTVSADRGRLQQLLENLFRNAVEHGSTSPDSQAHQDAVEHGPDDVTVTVGILSDGFYVADDGPGIPESERETVFDAGYSTTSGTGFGLVIVEAIATAHGWNVRVTESDDGGMRVELAGVEFVE
jgi:PAS domain S-box-containing protein